MEVNRKEKVDELVSILRKYLNQIEAEDNAIINENTRSLDDYHKDIYVQMHCIVAMYDTVLTDAQVKYMRRIFLGMERKDDIEGYICASLKLGENEFKEYIGFMKESEVKYYVALESILINVLGDPTQNTYDFLAELLQVMEVQRDDLNYLVQVAKSIIMQDDRLLYEAFLRIAI